MSFRRVNVKSAPALQATPAAAGGISPDAYTRWRATTLGAVTEALEQHRVFELLGPVDGKRVLDLGSGDGRLTAALATRGAFAVGIDIDHSMLLAATARPEDVHRRSARFARGRLEQLPFRDASFDVVVAVTVLCLVPDQTVAVREAARVLRPGGRMVIGDLGRWNAWAARRRIKGWFASSLWRSAHFSSSADLTRLLERAGLTVEAVRGSVYYPPSALLAKPLARLDRWIGAVTTLGAAFIAVAATKGDVPAQR
jgi:ubiquinone/menaquinone biosynthesis C-methylase UbiE